MKTNIIFSICLLAVFAMSCSQPKGDGTQLAQKVTELEKKVDQLTQELSDQKLKTRIVNDMVFGSPLENFFASDEFWENPVDVAQQECSKRCIRNAQQHREACAKIENEEERLRCYKEATASASDCQKSCWRL